MSAQHSVGDIVNCGLFPGTLREITEVRETGYSWIYPGYAHLGDFWSENSTDPMLTMWIRTGHARCLGSGALAECSSANCPDCGGSGYRNCPTCQTNPAWVVEEHPCRCCRDCLDRLNTGGNDDSPGSRECSACTE